MILHRTSVLVAAMALGASVFAVAQTPPPASTDPGNTSSVPNPRDSVRNDTSASDAASPSSGTQAAQDPKSEQCVSAEKAKNTGLSENQLKQKCMLKIASEQGKGH
jgi:hypothetical protein